MSPIFDVCLASAADHEFASQPYYLEFASPAAVGDLPRVLVVRRNALYFLTITGTLIATLPANSGAGFTGCTLSGNDLYVTDGFVLQAYHVWFIGKDTSGPDKALDLAPLTSQATYIAGGSETWNEAVARLYAGQSRPTFGAPVVRTGPREGIYAVADDGHIASCSPGLENFSAGHQGALAPERLDAALVTPDDDTALICYSRDAALVALDASKPGFPVVLSAAVPDPTPNALVWLNKRRFDSMPQPWIHFAQHGHSVVWCPGIGIAHALVDAADSQSTTTTLTLYTGVDRWTTLGAGAIARDPNPATLNSSTITVPGVLAAPPLLHVEDGFFAYVVITAADNTLRFQKWQLPPPAYSGMLQTWDVAFQTDLSHPFNLDELPVMQTISTWPPSYTTHQTAVPAWSEWEALCIAQMCRERGLTGNGL
jgi:hypothetical protein